MFSYIYADQSGVHCMQVARTQKGAEKLAINNIHRMAQNEFSYAKEPEELKKVLDAVEAKNVEQAIENWNLYQAIHNKKKISFHKITPASIVE